MVQRRCNDHRRLGTTAVAAEESARQTLLVVVFQEIEHMPQPLVAVLHPLPRDTLCRPTLTGHTAQVVVHAHFVVQVVKPGRQISIVLIRIVAFTDENELLMFLLHLRNRPSEELNRNHLGHVHADAVNALTCPEKQNIAHLNPCVRNRIKLFLSAALVEHAVVQLHRLVPIVLARVTRETIITRHLGRELLITLQVLVHRELFPGDIIKIIQRRERPLGMIGLA